MTGDQTLHLPGPKDSAPPAALAEQQAAHDAGGFSAEAVYERGRESLLPAIDDRVGKNAAERLLEDVLGRAAAHLQLRWDGGGELYQLVVEQRNARLDRMRHAHAVDFGEDVEGQIVF